MEFSQFLQLSKNVLFSAPLLDPIIFDASCPKSACNRNSASDFHVGKVYQYDYQVDVISEMRSASPKQPSQMNLKARVNLNVLSSCEYILEVHFLLEMLFQNMI